MYFMFLCSIYVQNLQQAVYVFCKFCVLCYLVFFTSIFNILSYIFWGWGCVGDGTLYCLIQVWIVLQFLSWNNFFWIASLLSRSSKKFLSYFSCLTFLLDKVFTGEVIVITIHKFFLVGCFISCFHHDIYSIY